MPTRERQHQAHALRLPPGRAAHAARRLHHAQRQGRRDLRRQGGVAAQPRAQLLRRAALAGAEDAGAGASRSTTSSTSSPRTPPRRCTSRRRWSSATSPSSTSGSRTTSTTPTCASTCRTSGRASRSPAASRNDGARYFGPYASASSVRTTLSIVKKLFPWRSCTKAITGTDPRPCLDYFIHRCIAPCTAYCTKEEYDEVIRQTILFLEGKTDEVVKSLKTQMSGASEALQFERAALFRDQLKAVESVAEKQFVERIRPDGRGRLRPGAPARTKAAPRPACRCFFIRGTQMVGRDFFTLDGVAGRDRTATCSAASSSSSTSRAVYVPKTRRRALRGARGGADRGVADARSAARKVEHRGGAARHAAPHGRAGDGERARVAGHAARALAGRHATSATRPSTQLQDELDLPTYPRRIECYDNSNIQGTSPVASMVVFIDGQPRPQEYRRFRIKTVVGANDFASMAEILRPPLQALGERSRASAAVGRRATRRELPDGVEAMPLQRARSHGLAERTTARRRRCSDAQRPTDDRTRDDDLLGLGRPARPA